ncbi:MAG: PQQ-dependent sugar dehydrogenase [Solirubrobacteraceae bacterium]
MSRRALVAGLVLAAALPATAAARVTLAPSVGLTTVARGMGTPSNLAFGARGAMWTTSAAYGVSADDGVWLTRRPGARPVHVVRGLRTALGLVWHRGELYVSFVTGDRGRIDAYSRFDGRRFGRRRTVLSNLPVGQHNVNSIAAGPDGRLYVGIGSVGDARRGPDPRSAAVLSFLPSGRAVRVEAHGLRNPFGLAFIPGTRDLLVSDNGRDDLGLSGPPDELNLVRTAGPARDFGFPRCPAPGGGDCRGVMAPLLRLAPHAAAAGVAVSPRFGSYGLTAFVAENGSSFAANPTGGDVIAVLLRPRPGGYRAVRRRLGAGFGRFGPAGAAVARDGSLWVTLLRSGRIVRFRPPVQRRSTVG